MHILLYKNLENLIFKKVIPNRLERHINLSLERKLAFIDSFQVLSYSIGILVKNLDEIDSKHLIKEFDSEVLDCFQQKVFCPWEMFNKTFPRKRKSYNSLSGKRISGQEYQHVF